VGQRLSHQTLQHSQHESIRFGEDKPNVDREDEMKKPGIATGEIGGASVLGDEKGDWFVGEK
jgi:hypothetical protein